ncbi:hypothetical protein C8R48DRAFT_782332 [Suillus tomentosus]|nr:hypothetical protein C8R48DRAFT_782332 [Suillus tomentosus]
MSNIISTFLSTSQPSLDTHLEIEYTESALRSWLQARGTKILPDSLFVAVSVLLGSVDLHDLISLLDTSLREVATRKQLQPEEESGTALPVQTGRCLMEEMMYRAQMEVSLFSTAMANLCEQLNTTTNATNSPTSCLTPKKLSVDAVDYAGSCQEFRSAHFDCFPPTRYKCMAWLSACHKASALTSSHLHDRATEVGDNAGRILLHDSPQYLKDSSLHKPPLKPGDRIPYLPIYLKALVGDMTYRAYVSASVAETNKSLARTCNSDSSNAESKKLDELKSDFRIMYLKKQRAQAEVDMFAEAIARIVVEGTSDGSATTFESHPPDHVNDWFDDWNSTSSLSSSSASAHL